MDIQFEVQKIHSQFGTTEMANYQIQKLFDKLILEDRAEQLRKHSDVVQRERFKCDCCSYEYSELTLKTNGRKLCKDCA